MTTGVPIYLVSACASGEEFVAAFRRYADKSGLFVPIADPFPVGCKGRFALTLTDGGVMIEGQAEVTSSARAASLQHGRIGMTIKFGELDEPSKTVLAELEKARLSMKPAPPSIPPRPADVPKEPRPRPPAPHGRIDAVNAIAECVAIGDLAAIGVTPGAAVPPKAGPRFVVPTIPPMSAAARARSTSAPPLNKPNGNHPAVTRRDEAPPTIEDVAPALAATRTVPDIAPPEMPVPRATPQPDALRKESGPLVAPKPAEPPISGYSTTMPAVTPVGPISDTLSAVTPAPALVGRAPSESELVTRSAEIAVPRTGTIQAVAPPPPQPAATPPVGMREAIPQPRNGAGSAPTAVGSPVIDEAELADDLVEEMPSPRVFDALKTIRGPGSDLTKTVRSSPPRQFAKPSTAPPPLPPPRTPTPSAPVPVVGARPPSSGGVEIGEPTDLTAPPEPEPSREPKKTSIGVPVGPPGVTVLPGRPASDQEPTGGGRIVAAITNDLEVSVPAAAVRTPPTVEEATPSGDWTMTPGASGPTLLPRKPESPVRDRTKPLPSGDWMISLDPQAPDGWSEPSKVEKAAEPAKPKLAKRVEIEPPAVAPAPAGDGEPKVQIDPTLIEPLQPMPALEPLPTPPPDGPQVQPVMMPYPPMPSATGPQPAYPMDPQQQMAVMGFPPQQRMVTDAGTGFFRDSGAMLTYPSEPNIPVVRSQKRQHTIVIITSAAIAVVLGAIIVIALAGKSSDDTGPPPPGSGDPQHAVALPPAPHEQAAVPAPADAGAGVVPIVVDAAPLPDCYADVASAPPGAEVVIDKTRVIGMTPERIPLPCDGPIELIFRKGKLAPITRTITPTKDGVKVRVAFAKPTVTVKVSSIPAGATITMNGKSIGITPTTVRLVQGEASTLTIAKDGFAPDVQKVSPNSNGYAVRAVLKKQGAPKRPSR